MLGSGDEGLGSGAWRLVVYGVRGLRLLRVWGSGVRGFGVEVFGFASIQPRVSKSKCKCCRYRGPQSR